MGNFKSINHYLCKTPSPLSGLALAIASLGLCWESIAKINGSAQVLGAILASFILISLFLKFLINPALLKQDLQHPIAGSVIPTLTMATMVVANTIGLYDLQIGQAVSWFAIILQLFFLTAFVFYRINSFNFKQILPSWFIPPIGLALAIVTHPGGLPTTLSNIFLVLGLLSYALLLPIVLYRLIFSGALDNNQKPIIAILATPASLLIITYLASVPQPNHLLFTVLLIVAILMTLYVYFAFISLLRLPFSPIYSALTFPLVVSAIALFKTSQLFLKEGIDMQWVSLTTQLANLELIIATVMVIYVTFRYLKNYWPSKY
ncbi:MAG: TDT family transporter [Colwellia sp.]